MESALRHVAYLDKYDFQNFKVSVKASDVFMAVAAYRQLAKEIEQPLHLVSPKPVGSDRAPLNRRWASAYC